MNSFSEIKLLLSRSILLNRFSMYVSRSWSFFLLHCDVSRIFNIAVIIVRNSLRSIVPLLSMSYTVNLDDPITWYKYLLVQEDNYMNTYIHLSFFFRFLLVDVTLIATKNSWKSIELIYNIKIIIVINLYWSFLFFFRRNNFKCITLYTTLILKMKVLLKFLKTTKAICLL